MVNSLGSWSEDPGSNPGLAFYSGGVSSTRQAALPLVTVWLAFLHWVSVQSTWIFGERMPVAYQAQEKKKEGKNRQRMTKKKSFFYFMEKYKKAWREW